MVVGYRPRLLHAPAENPQISAQPKSEPLLYDAALGALHASYAEETAAKIETMAPRDPLWFINNPAHTAARAARRRITGRERLALLNKTLDSFGYERFEEQRVFHREMTKAIIPHLFRDDLDENIDALMREFKCTRFCSELMIISQRRKGKTFSVAMFAAACMIALGEFFASRKTREFKKLTKL